MLERGYHNTWGRDVEELCFSLAKRGEWDHMTHSTPPSEHDITNYVTVFVRSKRSLNNTEIVRGVELQVRWMTEDVVLQQNVRMNEESRRCFARNPFASPSVYKRVPYRSRPPFTVITFVLFHYRTSFNLITVNKFGEP